MATTKTVRQEANCGDAEMVRILKEMLESDETITARAAARKHPSIQHASSITRHEARSLLLDQYQAMQNERRAWLQRLPKYSRAKAASEMADKDRHIAELQKQVEFLRISHVAMIRAVGELGGMSKWLRFFESYREIRDELKKLAALPVSEVKMIDSSKAELHGREDNGE